MRLSGIHSPPPASLADLARRGNLAALRNQLLYGVDPNSLDWQGNTPLQVVARQGDAQAVQCLLLFGASVDATDRQHGMTALMWAALKGHGPVVQSLLDVGADPLLQDRYGKSAATLAREHGHSEICSMLQQYAGQRQDVH